MSKTLKKRLCWNCEGSVPRTSSNCPYCGVYLHREEDEEIEEEEEYAPPYQLRESDTQNQEIPHPPYTLNNEETKVTVDKTIERKSSDLLGAQSDTKNVVLSLLLLLSGSLFLLFGVILFLFSDRGVFTLKWNGSHWFLYLLLSLPLLFFGWRVLQLLDPEEQVSKHPEKSK